MAHWKAQLELKDVWKKYEDGEMTIAEVAGVVAERLKATPYVDNFQMSEIIEQFTCIAADGKEARLKEFEELMDELYDFGDCDHRLWINTI